MVWRGRSDRTPAVPTLSVFVAPEVRRARLFSPREFGFHARGIRIRDESGPFAASGESAGVLGRLAVVTGEERDLVACYQRVKALAQDGSVKKLDVLVCVPDPESESQGRRIFTQLFEICRRFLDVDLAYIGAFARGEKIRDNRAIENYLLHYQGGSRDSESRHEAE